MKTLIAPKLPAYTFVKGNVYYFARAIPEDLKNYYSRPRVIQSLRTTNRRLAVHSSRFLFVRLEDYWNGLRFRYAHASGAHLLTQEHPPCSSTVITFILKILTCKRLLITDEIKIIRPHNPIHLCHDF